MKTFISFLTLLWIGELGIRRNDIILTTKRDQIDERVFYDILFCFRSFVKYLISTDESIED